MGWEAAHAGLCNPTKLPPAFPPCSARRQDTRSPTLAPTQRLSPAEALPPVSQGGADKAPELPARSGPEPPAPGAFSLASPPSSPNDWPQERSPGGRSDSASPRGPVPNTLPGLRHAPWQGLRDPPDSPDGSPLTPVPTQMPWLVASPEPPQSSPTPAFPLVCWQLSPCRRLGWRWSCSFTARCFWGLSSVPWPSLADRACSQVVGAEVLKVGSELAPSPLVCSLPNLAPASFPRRGAVPG